MADQDDMRNGQPTVWRRYQTEFADEHWQNEVHHGRTFAEIDGALLASLVTEQVMSVKGSLFSAEQLLEVLHLIDHHQYFETVAGWQIQYKLNHVQLSEATEAEFMKGLELVTARYTFVGPLMIGLSLGSASPELKAALTQYGTAVGTAFQIQDDILGLFGDPEETGKPVGNDVREGKKTLLLQRAYQSANEADKTFLSKVCGRELSDQELTRVQDIVKDTGSLAYSQKLAQEYIDKGIAALSSLDQNKEEVLVLRELAQYVLKRNV
jgi:geranylgeranyl diphosphate synthase type I